ncbi:MAG: hypothetical protein A2156_14685 [Deltaproteobacteria bacterium RBG_16_48_10]|nr:MAG: hypothetical protein A2156_14685 [Deltaproteobacteria bacterium RBG_16_48_10]
MVPWLLSLQGFPKLKKLRFEDQIEPFHYYFLGLTFGKKSSVLRGPKPPRTYWTVASLTSSCNVVFRFFSFDATFQAQMIKTMRRRQFEGLSS